MNDFGEPWHIGHNLDDHTPPRWPEIDNSKNLQVIIPPTEEDADRLLPKLERIVACVNACKGYSTHFLEQLAESQLPIPIDEADKPGGDTEAQARAWRHVWGKLVDMGMLSKGPFVNASTRALAFLDTLQSKEDSND